MKYRTLGVQDTSLSLVNPGPVGFDPLCLPSMTFPSALVNPARPGCGLLGNVGPPPNGGAAGRGRGGARSPVPLSPQRPRKLPTRFSARSLTARRLHARCRAPRRSLQDPPP